MTTCLRSMCAALCLVAVALCASPAARGAQAAMSVELPGGKHKTVRLRNLPKSAVMAVAVETSGPIAISLLSEPEYRLYDSLLSTLGERVQKPDLVVFLQSSLNRLIRNIRNRGRAMEEHITVGYLRDLSEAYSRHFFRHTDVPTLIVNTLEVDFINDPTALEALIDEIGRPDTAPVRLFHMSGRESIR